MLLVEGSDALEDEYLDPFSSMVLPPLPRPFFVPSLTDQPQNPIIKRLKEDQERGARDTRVNNLSELQVLLRNLPAEPDLQETCRDIWSNALTRRFELERKVLSWDVLRHKTPIKASTTGFLTEQDSFVFAAARYRVDLSLRDHEMDIIYVTQGELLNALKTTVLGTSSVYHVWDASVERFVPAGSKRRLLLMDGVDELISESLVSRFLTIGTLLRRLDTFLILLREKSSKDKPIVHAYAHALSTILMFLRYALARLPPVNGSFAVPITLSAIWIRYEVYRDILEALAKLSGRDFHKLPEDYPVFDSSPVTLMSAVYHELEYHIERQSLRAVIATFAFMITRVSHKYLQRISQSIGYCVDPVKRSSRPTQDRHNLYSFDGEELNDEELANRNSEPLHQLDSAFPNFFPKNLEEILPAAQKSLILLEGARPNHPILQQTTTRVVIHWFWSHTHIESAWKGDYPNNSHDSANMPLHDMSITTGANDLYPDFLIFRLFDQEPGTHPTVADANKDMISLEAFIEQFPANLPPTTPTLAQLTSLVLQPLIEHAQSLSSALLDVFLTPSTSSIDTLSFQAHATLLRSYLLVTSAPFKSRLAAALFSDQEDPDHNYEAHGMSIRYLRRKSSRNKASIESLRPWPVGLSPSLLERETWPPVGADLSFFLRTVIVDSFSDRGMYNPNGSGELLKSQVLEEAEYRLGFTIRDLPVGPGKDKWLSPLSIEALDFLSMDYKPPTPLEVLITPEILSRYQRVFTFILRLIRVEHALNSLFRMSRVTAKPLFPTLVSCRKLLFHFHFTAHSFVSNLSTYVFDVAIGGNFDPFILSLAPRRDNQYVEFSDVFALAKKHSTLLDDVLAACLLRSSQRAVGTVLRNLLELILEFAVLVGELHRGRVEEYQAAPTLDDLWAKFNIKVGTLMKALKGLADKNGAFSGSSQNTQAGDLPRKPVGGVDALYQLFIRLELGDWWSRNSRQMTQ